MDVRLRDGLVRFFLPLEDKVVFRYPLFRDVFPRQVEGDVREGDDAEFRVFFGPLLVIVRPGTVPLSTS
jgi:hypothetical protein